MRTELYACLTNHEPSPIMRSPILSPCAYSHDQWRICIINTFPSRRSSRCRPFNTYPVNTLPVLEHLSSPIVVKSSAARTLVLSSVPVQSFPYPSLLPRRWSHSKVRISADKSAVAIGAVAIGAAACSTGIRPADHDLAAVPVAAEGPGKFDVDDSLCVSSSQPARSHIAQE